MPNHSDLKFRSRISLHWMNMFTSNQIKFYLVTHYIYYVHFIASDVTEEIL